MKYVKFFGIIALAVGFAACNDDATSSTTTDSTTVDTTITGATTTSNVDYAALADSFRTNSEAGNYLDPKTGKPLRIKYDVTTKRAVNEATGEPVWRYVDKRNWWVYGSDNDMWDTIGTAKMQGNNLVFRTDTDTWVTYDERWADDTSDNDGVKVSDDGNKIKDGDTKVKVADDGNKVKVKVGDEKVKVKDGKVKSDN